MKLSEIILGLLKIPTDFLMGIFAFLIAYQLRTKTDLIPGIQLPLDLHSFPPFNEYLQFSAIAIAALVMLLALNKAYSLKTTRSLNKEIGQVWIISGTWFMLIIAYFFIIREFPFSRLALAYSWIITAIFVAAGRSIIRFIEYFLLQAGIGKRKLLFIGNNHITDVLYKSMKKNPKYTVVGILGKQEGSHKNLGNIQDLGSIIKKHHIEEILQTTSDITHAQAEDILEFCRENHVGYRFVPDLVAMHKTNIDIETEKGYPIITLKPTPLDGWGRVLKRIFDLAGALIGIVILSPIMIFSAIAIRLDSKGTILFKYLDDGARVKRVGQKGKLFNFYKFRTMKPGTHNLRYNELSENDVRKDQPLVKIKNDPRITRVGKFLRKTSIDELPQLFNVLKGEMSLVGPRPHLPEEVDNYKDHHKFVLTIKPGITGLAQISGRSDLEFEEEVRLDSYYIENWSLWMDIKIIFKTVGVLFNDYQE